MNRIFTRISAFLLIALLLSASLVSCGSTAPSAKLGLGVQFTTPTGTDANEDIYGKGTVTVTAAAVLVDSDGKIVACQLDSIDTEAKYDAAGAYVTPGEFLTKHEQGDSYGMKAYAGSALEWYEQADAFASLCIGKTLDQVKALVVDGGTGSADVIAAGCTINVADFALAVEKAYNNATVEGADTAGTLGLAMTVSHTAQNADEDVTGNVTYTVTFAAVATSDTDRARAAVIDEADVKFEFTATGASATKNAPITTKREQGDSYGMKAYAGSALEWYEQADALAAACLDKTADEITALVVDGYGSDDIKAAGCTIAIGNMVKTIVKAAAN